MKFLLDDLNLKSYDEVKLAFLTVPKTSNEICISDRFEKSIFSYSTVYQNLHYLPEYVHTVNFEYLSNLVNTSPELIGVEKIGDHLMDFVVNLPSWIQTVKLAFSIYRRPANAAHQQNLPPVSDGFINVFAKIPPHICHFDLSGCEMSVSSLELIKILSAIPPQIKELDLGKFKIGKYSLPERESVLRAIPKTVKKLSFHFNEFYHDKSIRNLIRMFNGIHPKISSLSLANNKLGLEADALYFRALLASIVTSFPELKELKLRRNRFHYYIHQNCFDECLKVLPPSIVELDIGENGLLSAGPLKFISVFKEFPRAIKAIDVVDLVSNSMPEFDSFFELLPNQIQTLRLTNQPWLGLEPINFSRILSSIPSHVHTLDLSQNSFHTKSIEEIVRVIKAIPNHVTHLILKRNFLSIMSLTKFNAMMNALPKTICMIDLEDNGLEHLEHSLMNLYLDSIPDLEIRLDFQKIAIHPNGSLVSNKHAENYLVRPKRLFHQKESLERFIGLSQLFRSKGISIQNMELIASYAISDYEKRKISLKNQLIKISSQNFFEQELNVRISQRVSHTQQTNSPRLDFSLMGMFLCHDTKLMIDVFKKIPTHVKYVNLSFNRRTESSEARECTFQALRALPQTIEVLDLRGNGFEKLSKSFLNMWLGSLSSHIKIIISEEIPVTFTNYLLRMSIPDFYRTMTHEYPKFLNKAEILLDDYTQGDSLFRRLLVGYWNRNHTQEVDKMVWKIRHNIIGNIRDVIQEFAAMRLKNDAGSLAKIIMYLVHELEKSENPQQSPIQVLQVCK